MTARDSDSTARRAVAALGIEGADLAPLGGGLASEAWRVGRGDPWFALRIANERSTTDAGYQMEHALMGRLADAGARVPRPIRGSWQLEHWDGPPFSCATGLDGTPLAVEDGVRAAPVLAAFLRLLHGSPSTATGALEVHDGRLQGAASTMAAGLTAWAGRPLWPLGDARLDTHPALAERRALACEARRPCAAVRLALSARPAVCRCTPTSTTRTSSTRGCAGQSSISGRRSSDLPRGSSPPSPTSSAGRPPTPRSRPTLGTRPSRRGCERTRQPSGSVSGCTAGRRIVELGIDEDAYDEAFLVETLIRG